MPWGLGVAGFRLPTQGLGFRVAAGFLDGQDLQPDVLG